MKHLLFLLVFTGLIISAPARSFIDPPTLDPSSAMAGQTVHLRLRTGICDAVLGGPNNPAITVNGTNVDVLIDGLRRTDPILCMFQIVDHEWALAAFAPGTYSVTVRFRYTPFLLPTVIETLGVLPLNVQGQPAPVPQPVPALGWAAIVLLIVTIMIWGGWRRANL